MLKKLTLLAAAVGALVAFAAPASAMAEPFTDNGGPIPAGGVNVTYTGWAEFAGANGGVRCEHVEGEITFTTEDAHVTSFTGTECHTVGLLAALGCNVENEHAEGVNTPWTVDPNTPAAGQATITNITVNNQIEPCLIFPAGQLAQVTGNVTVNQLNGLDEIELAGTATALGEPVTIHGELESLSPGTISMD